MRSDRQKIWSAGGTLLGWLFVFSGGACGHDPYTVGAVCEAREEKPCYTGPTGTEGVGACKAGIRICNEDREGFGACQFEVTPGPEVCVPEDAEQFDEDCDGVVNEEGEGCECTSGDEEPCYEGPTGTEGSGLCIAGTRVCELSLWAACTGQTLPADEDCTNLVDEDCDGRACAAPLWSLVAGDPVEQRVTALAVDSQGDTFVTGYFAGTLDLGGTPLQAVGARDVFVARLRVYGDVAWARSFGTPAEEIATAVAVGPDGAVVIAGTYYQDIDFDDTSLKGAGDADAFLVRLDGASGAVTWGRARSVVGDQTIAALAVTKGGAIFAAGSFTGYLVCPALCGAGLGDVESNGAHDAFVWALDPAGDQLALGRFGGIGVDRARAITVDGAGNAIVAGDFSGSMPVGMETLKSAGPLSPDIFLVELSADSLAPLSARAFGDEAAQRATAIAWLNGDILLTGTSSGVVDWGFVTTGQAEIAQIVVAKLAKDTAGSWARAFTADEVMEPRLAVAADGRVALAGTFGGTIDFGSGPLLGGEGLHPFLAQLFPDGSASWAKAFGTGTSDEGTAVAVAPNGDLVFGAAARSPFDFGLGVETHAGASDVAVARFSP